MKTKNPQSKKSNLNIKINLGIILVVSLLSLFIFPNMIFKASLPEDDSPIYAHESFIYPSLYDICPCSASEEYDYDSCAGYFACSSNMANLPYNFDNAPEETMKAARHDAYFESRIDFIQFQIRASHATLLTNLSQIIGVVGLIVGLIYGIHNLAGSKK